MTRRAPQSTAARRPPDFLIVGAAKSGTTSLFHYLAQHPALFLPVIDKEPGYYCDIWGTDDPDYYFGLFEGARPHQMRGEASTPYLTCPASAHLIHADNPAAKIIAILRNPAERAFSLYLQMVKAGLETLVPIEKALDAEPRRAARDPHARRIPGYYHNFLYTASGRYDDQLPRYLELFPPQQRLILLFDDLVANPRETVAHALEFLGVDPAIRFNPEIFNPSRFPRSPRLQHLLKRGLEDQSRALGIHRGVRLANRLKTMNLRRGTTPGLSDATYNKLAANFTTSIRATAKLIGRDLTAWTLPRG